MFAIAFSSRSLMDHSVDDGEGHGADKHMTLCGCAESDLFRFGQ